MQNQNQVVVSNKNQFIDNVRKWVYVDMQIKELQGKIKKYRDFKSKLTPQICTYMEENQMKNKKIEITNGELKMVEKKDYSPLTFSYIEECLTELIPEAEHVEYIIQYLKDHREIKTSIDLRRTTQNNKNSGYETENES